MNIMNDELIKISDDIYSKYINDEELESSIKVSCNNSPTNNEFLLLKRDLKKRLSKLDDTFYIDDIQFEFARYSKDEMFNYRVKYYPEAFYFSFGLITPFLLLGSMFHLYEYYTTENYNYIKYDITKRKSNVI